MYLICSSKDNDITKAMLPRGQNDTQCIICVACVYHVVARKYILICYESLLNALKIVLT